MVVTKYKKVGHRNPPLQKSLKGHLNDSHHNEKMTQKKFFRHKLLFGIHVLVIFLQTEWVPFQFFFLKPPF